MHEQTPELRALRKLRGLSAGDMVRIHSALLGHNGCTGTIHSGTPDAWVVHTRFHRFGGESLIRWSADELELVEPFCAQL